MKLSDDQKAAIHDCCSRTTDLNEIVREVFDNPLIDGRSKEGRLVRAYMISAGIKFNTSRKVKSDKIEFTPEQLQYIADQAKAGLSSLKIAAVIFPDKDVGPLSVEQRAVFAVMKEMDPNDSSSQEEEEGLSAYVPPKATSRVLLKINNATGNSFVEEKLNRQHKICVEKLGINLSNSRFVKIVNNYLSREDRILFEEEFIRLTWDKPDLTSDEINLYMNVCKEIVNLEVVSKHMNRLNEIFDVVSGQEEMSVKLSEIIKTKSSEYHQCETRIENLTKKLQGDRSNRIQNKARENASILALVQFFQDDEERVNMVKIAEMQKALVKEEAERLEGMAEWKARFLGMSIEDVL